MYTEFQYLLNCIPHKFKPQEEAVLKKAFNFSKLAHTGQKRKSGEEYFIHPVEATIILGKIFPDCSTLAATLMHDVPEDTSITLETINKDLVKKFRY